MSATSRALYVENTSSVISSCVFLLAGVWVQTLSSDQESEDKALGQWYSIMQRTWVLECSVEQSCAAHLDCSPLNYESPLFFKPHQAGFNQRSKHTDKGVIKVR